MARRAACHRHLINHISCFLCGFNHPGDGSLNLIGLLQDAGVVGLGAERIIDACRHIPLGTEPL